MKTSEEILAFKLSPSDRSSGAWGHLREQLRAMLQQAREKNDSAPLDKTERIRGEIGCLKTILKFAEDDPRVEPIGGGEHG